MSLLKKIILYGCKYFGLFILAELVTKNELRILCYHNISVFDEYKFKPHLHIKADVFKKRIQYLLDRRYKFVSLEKGLASIQNGNVNKNVVITFDDGWFSNKIYGHPILFLNKVPYTIYLASYYSSNGFPVTNIIVPYIFWKSCILEPNILDRFSKHYRIRASNQTEIVIQIVDMCNTLKAKDERIHFLSKIAELLEVDLSQIINNRSFEYLTQNEIRTMAKEGVDFQLHTHSHFFPEEDTIAMNEIKENRDYIERVTGKKATHFCYPSGRIKNGHFSVLKRQKIYSAVTCRPGLNGKDTPKYLLNRFLDSEAIPWIIFQAELSGFMPLIRKTISIFSINKNTSKVR